MNPKMKKMIVEDRRRRKDGTYMNYPDIYNEKSGTRIVRRDGTSYPVYPSTPRMDYDLERRYLPRYGYDEDDMESRFRDRRGREHYDNGRYAPMRGAYSNDLDDTYSGYPIYPTVPPIYTGYDRSGDTHDYPDGRPAMRIGFITPEEDHSRYGSRVDVPRMHEDEYRRSEMSKGWAEAMEPEPMTKDTAMEWVKRMKNEDGTTGPHWTMEQTRQVMDQYNIQCDEIEFFVAMNMMYSDYCKVAKKHNCSTIEFYTGMAKAFLDDKDAYPEKLVRYYECIVKR